MVSSRWGICSVSEPNPCCFAFWMCHQMSTDGAAWSLVLGHPWSLWRQHETADTACIWLQWIAKDFHCSYCGAGTLLLSTSSGSGALLEKLLQRYRKESGCKLDWLSSTVLLLLIPDTLLRVLLPQPTGLHFILLLLRCFDIVTPMLLILDPFLEVFCDNLHFIECNLNTNTQLLLGSIMYGVRTST